MTTTHNTRNTTRSTTKRRPSVALVLAFVALLAALSNGAYAVTTAQKNTVTSKSIKNGAVKAADLAPLAVRTDKIANGAVTNPKLRDGSVDSAKIADGSIKAVDLAPGVIPGNDPGNPAPASFLITTVSSDSASTTDADGFNNGGQHGLASATATCPADTLAVGGGAVFFTGPIFNPDSKNNYLKSQLPHQQRMARLGSRRHGRARHRQAARLRLLPEAGHDLTHARTYGPPRPQRSGGPTAFRGSP